MDVSVPPVTRGEFLYRDTLLVDVGGELKRHPRAREAEIKGLLNGKNVPKDQVAHWYEAQLIHYGLQRSKSKDTAKVRLQQALNKGQLKAQPPHLADMEGQMKREYTASIRKAKRQAKSSGGKGIKRVHEEEHEHSSKKTKISVRVGDVSIDIDQSEASSSKKQKTIKSTQAKKEEFKKPTKSTLSKSEQTRKPTPAKTKGKESVSAQAMPGSQRKKSTTADKSDSATSWTGNPREHPDNIFQTSTKSSAIDFSQSMPQPKAKKELVKREPKAKNETSTNRAIPVKHELYGDNDDLMDTRPDISDSQMSITGVYNIASSQLAEQAPDDVDKFRLFICVDNEAGKIWGSFELAWKSGVIRIDDNSFNKTLSFGWRAKDYEANGRLKFGKGCFGELEFYGHGEVGGVFRNLFPEPVFFSGFRRPGPLWCGRSAYSFQQEWDGYPREAYGR